MFEQKPEWLLREDLASGQILNEERLGEERGKID